MNAEEARRRALRKKRIKKNRRDLLSILLGLVFIVFASIMIAVLSPDEDVIDQTSDNSDVTSLVGTDEMLESIVVKDSTCLLGETEIEISDFIVNPSNYPVKAAFITQPSASTPGDLPVEIILTAPDGTTRNAKTTLRVLYINKYVSLPLGGPTPEYTDIVLDSSISATFSPALSEIDCSKPSRVSVKVTVGMLSYECIVIIADTPTTS